MSFLGSGAIAPYDLARRLSIIEAKKLLEDSRKSVLD